MSLNIFTHWLLNRFRCEGRLLVHCVVVVLFLQAVCTDQRITRIPARTCSELGDIPNGKVNATSENQYGSVVKYECDVGYQIDTGVPRTYCQGNQVWKHGGILTTCASRFFVLPCFNTLFI